MQAPSRSFRRTASAAASAASRPTSTSTVLPIGRAAPHRGRPSAAFAHCRRPPAVRCCAARTPVRRFHAFAGARPPPVRINASTGARKVPRYIVLPVGRTVQKRKPCYPQVGQAGGRRAARLSWYTVLSWFGLRRNTVQGVDRTPRKYTAARRVAGEGGYDTLCRR